MFDRHLAGFVLQYSVAERATSALKLFFIPCSHLATSSPVTHKTTDSFISLSGGPLEVGSYVLSEEKVEGVALGEEAYLTVFGRAVVETPQKPHVLVQCIDV